MNEKKIIIEKEKNRRERREKNRKEKKDTEQSV